MANKQDLIAKVAEATELTKKIQQQQLMPYFLQSKLFLLKVKKYN